MAISVHELRQWLVGRPNEAELVIENGALVAIDDDSDSIEIGEMDEEDEESGVRRRIRSRIARLGVPPGCPEIFEVLLRHIGAADCEAVLADLNKAAAQFKDRTGTGNKGGGN